MFGLSRWNSLHVLGGKVLLWLRFSFAALACLLVFRGFICGTLFFRVFSSIVYDCTLAVFKSINALHVFS